MAAALPLQSFESIASAVATTQQVAGGGGDRDSSTFVHVEVKTEELPPKKGSLTKKAWK